MVLPHLYNGMMDDREGPIPNIFEQCDKADYQDLQDGIS